jgi:hypothetical protein
MAVDVRYFTSFLGPVALGSNGILAMAGNDRQLLGEQPSAATADGHAQPALIRVMKL